MANPKLIITGILAIVIGVLLFPTLASFTKDVGYDWTTTADGNVSNYTWTADTNVTNVAGLTSVMDLVIYGVAFALVFLGIGMIYTGTKRK